MATPRFVVTDHALDRFVERYEGTDARKPHEYRQLLMRELARGVPFGGQRGNEQLLLLPCGLVAALVCEQGIRFVKTVLTRAYAIANMESRGAILRTARTWRDQVAPARRAPPKRLDPRQKDELRALAEQHFNAGMSWKERNASLREHGYDPAAWAGEIYRAEYQALERAKWAAA
jgi:hypothetical protein